MRILAISVGTPKTVRWHGKPVQTSIFKTPIDGPALVELQNIQGDRQSDLEVHGGLDKAVYAYSFDTYEWWRNQLSLDSLPYGAFGENLTLDQLDETQVFAGDVFEVGQCQLQAVQPRVPCFKLSIRFDDPQIIQTFYDRARCGVYFRVLKPGLIQAGDRFKLISSETTKVSMAELFQFIKNKGITTKARATELATIESLNIKWRNKFRQISELPE